MRKDIFRVWPNQSNDGLVICSISLLYGLFCFHSYFSAFHCYRWCCFLYFPVFFYLSLWSSFLFDRIGRHYAVLRYRILHSIQKQFSFFNKSLLYNSSQYHIYFIRAVKIEISLYTLLVQIMYTRCINKWRLFVLRIIKRY